MQITSIEELKKAPISKDSVLDNAALVKVLQALVNQPFILTGKSRTDGATLRKAISNLFIGKDIALAEDNQYKVVPEKGKGIPKMLALLLDSYIVTSGDSYNLQVWNRIPNSDDVLIQYENGDVITCKDIRYALIKVDTARQIIESIIIMTAEEIEDAFGSFGVPTIKHQLIISDSKRRDFIEGSLRVPIKDSVRMQHLCKTE